MSNVLHRRHVLSVATCSALATLVPRAPQFLIETAAAAELSASARNDNLLVVVQLSGGNDGLNMIVPRDRDEYIRARPTLAQTPGTLLKLNDELGLHPSLGGLASLWESQVLSIVQGVGYPNPNRSHFESFDIWHTAQRDTSLRSTGWLGRWSDMTGARETSDPLAIHVGGESQPLALAAHDSAASSFRSLDDLRLKGSRALEDRSAIAERLGAAPLPTDDFSRFLRATTVSALSTSRRVEAVVGDRSTSAKYPGSELARRLQIVAQLIEAGLSTRVYYVCQDGYDTHSKQAAAHAALLSDLGGALQAFHADLAQRGQDKRVAVMVFSEFGRRVRENASQGTDHGAAAPLLLVGGRVRAGVVGTHPSLTDLDDGDLKHQVDFRQIYATLLDEWLGCDAARVLGKSYDKLPVLA